jgi:competence protein ComFC
MFRQWASALSSVLFPSPCLSCGNEDTFLKSRLCLLCSEELPKTNFLLSQEPTSLDKLFWGRIALSFTYAELFFQPNSVTQSLLHELKYKGQKDIGIYFGKKIGEQLKEKELDFDALIPVPLHHRKKFKRGFNQAESIAKGLEDELRIPMDTNFVNRRIYTDSQTKRGKLLRWENMQERFGVNEKAKKYKHIALVDDVITTGSTIEAIAKEIRKKFPDIKISVLAIAYST